MLTVLLTSGRSSASRRLVGDAEDHPQDHLEGERVHPVEASGTRSPARQRATSSWASSVDQRLVAAQRVAVERRHQQLAGPLVLGAVLRAAASARP